MQFMVHPIPIGRQSRHVVPIIEPITGYAIRNDGSGQINSFANPAPVQ